MTRPEQQDQEVEWAGHLFRLLNGSRPIIRPQNPPEPDVVAETPNGVIGIELRELVAAQREFAREQEHAKVLEETKRLVNDASNARVQVQVAFSQQWLPQRSSRSDISRVLAQTVLQAMPEDQSGVSLSSSMPGCLELDDPRLTYVSVFRSDTMSESSWTVTSSWWGGNAPHQLVQLHIDAKRGKRAHYRAQYTQCWLLLHRSGSAPSSGYDVGDEIRQHEFKSEFDRVFLLTGVGSELVELTLEAATPRSDAV